MTKSPFLVRPVTGFHHNLIWLAVVMLLAETAIMFLLTAWSYAKITWEKR